MYNKRVLADTQVYATQTWSVQVYSEVHKAGLADKNKYPTDKWTAEYTQTGSDCTNVHKVYRGTLNRFDAPLHSFTVKFKHKFKHTRQS